MCFVQLVAKAPQEPETEAALPLGFQFTTCFACSHEAGTGHTKWRETVLQVVTNKQYGSFEASMSTRRVCQLLSPRAMSQSEAEARSEPPAVANHFFQTGADVRDVVNSHLFFFLTCVAV